MSNSHKISNRRPGFATGELIIVIAMFGIVLASLLLVFELWKSAGIVALIGIAPAMFFYLPAIGTRRRQEH